MSFCFSFFSGFSGASVLRLLWSTAAISLGDCNFSTSTSQNRGRGRPSPVQPFPLQVHPTTHRRSTPAAPNVSSRRSSGDSDKIARAIASAWEHFHCQVERPWPRSWMAFALAALLDGVPGFAASFAAGPRFFSPLSRRSVFEMLRLDHRKCSADHSPRHVADRSGQK